LFVLDNLEQLSGAASVISQLLEAAPQVAVIATSRRPLHVAGEHEHPVPPLSLPDQADALNVEVSGAVQLFVQHAKMVRPSFSVTDSNRADVVQVCRSLDGLPLAIELAAARSKLLSPAALVVRLDGALDLKDAGVDRPARQQTLRAAIAWSYDLLTSEQQAFFRELGVFAGSAGLDAVAAVTTDRAGTDRLTLVADLIDASLARISEDLHGEPRVGLLATIRTFAQDQLRAAGELDRMCRRHAEHFVSIADDLLPLVRGGGADQLLEARRRFELELDNFRDALRWTLGSEAENDPPPRSQVETGWRLCGALGWLWADGGYQGESWRWLERAVSLAGQDDSPDLGRCLSGLAGDLVAAGSYNRALRVARQSVDMWRRLGDSWELGIALTRLAVSAMLIGDDQPAREAFEEAIDHANDTGDGWLMARAWCNLADFETREHNYERARYLCNLAIPVMRERGDELGVLRVALSQAQLSWTMGLLTDAHQQMRLLIPEATRLATGELLLGAAEILGVISADRGDYRPAARLLGASDALRERTEMPRDPITVADMQKSLGKARAALTSDEWTHEYQRGHGMSVENALMGTYVAAAPTFE
jgi:predicted ATPase